MQKYVFSENLFNLLYIEIKEISKKNFLWTKNAIFFLLRATTHHSFTFIIGLSCLTKIFAKLKFSSDVFIKIPTFVCLVFKIENKLILKLQILFS